MNALHRLTLRLSATEIVQAISRGILGRDLDGERLDAYVRQLTSSGELSRIVAELSAAPEAGRRSLYADGAELLRLLFLGLLGREPDPDAYRAYVPRLQNDKDLQGTLAALTRSEEFWYRLLRSKADELARSFCTVLLNGECDEQARRVYGEQFRDSANLQHLVATIGGSRAHWEMLLGERSEELLRTLRRVLVLGAGEHKPGAPEEQSAPIRKIRDSVATLVQSLEHWHSMLAIRAEELVVGAYESLLKRRPDEHALRFYAAELRHSKDLPALLSSIAASQEHWEVLVRHRAGDLVRAAYAGLLQREPDAHALRTYGGQLRENNLPVLLSSIGDSQEHWENLVARRADELVAAAYQGLLNREPDEEALRAYGTQLRENKDLSWLLSSIAQSHEHWERLLKVRADDLLRALYHSLLGREPDEEALRVYAAQLQELRDLRPILSTVAASQEHWHRLLALNAEELVRETYRGLTGNEADEHDVLTYGAQLRESKSLPLLLSTLTKVPACWDTLLTSRSTDVVRAIYRGLFKEEPDKNTLAALATSFAAKKDLAALVSAVADSEEQTDLLTRGKSGPNPAISYDKPTVVFLHIQKTAGTSIQSMLREAYAPEKIYREYFDTLHLRSPAELSRHSVFAGHFNYDSLAYIPRSKLSLVTFVREPKKRLVSLYYFWRAHEPTHPSWGGGITLANQLSIREFFSTPEVENSGTWNHMTWAILGERKWRTWRGELRSIADDAAAAADFLSHTVRPAVRERLREFLFVGIQEDFARSVELLFKILNRPLPPGRAEHSLKQLTGQMNFKKRVRRRPITAEVDAILGRLVMLDDIVYSEARTLHAELLARKGPLTSPKPRISRHRVATRTTGLRKREVRR